jgi:hypothetical protein
VAVLLLLGSGQGGSTVAAVVAEVRVAVQMLLQQEEVRGGSTDAAAVGTDQGGNTSGMRLQMAHHKSKVSAAGMAAVGMRVTQHKALRSI